MGQAIKELEKLKALFLWFRKQKKYKNIGRQKYWIIIAKEEIVMKNL